MTTVTGPRSSAVTSTAPGLEAAVSRSRVAPEVTAGGGDGAERVTGTLRRVAGAIALVVVCFVQAPGLISPDTKLDLMVDPAFFLSRVWNLWDPLGGFGQLQNQAYGYLFPMGPFFVAGHLAGLPAWVVQRLWWALLLVAAYGGTLALAGRLRIGTPGTRIIAALAFALSPRAITELGGISVELWPSAIAPWVLVPLISPRRGTERRAAARSAVAVACAGGVNAVAVGAMFPLVVIWLAMTRRYRMACWWAVLVPAATFWWLVPLVSLGKYSAPFLGWIESSAATTSQASLPNALRGTTHWVAWLRGPLTVWPAGTDLVSSMPMGVLGWTGVLLALLALFLRSTPHRAFLVCSVTVGVLLVTAGHTGPGMPPWAGWVQGLLDGPAAAARNTHKFDVLIRLPLALGLAHTVAVLKPPDSTAFAGARHAARIAAISAIVGTAAPAMIGLLPASGAFAQVPSYWAQAAAWLNAHPDGGRTLVVPGAPFATSVWGDSRDEPLQPLARTPWAVRNVVPLSSAGNIRFLTLVDQQLATGRPSPGLAPYLARAGVTRLLVRADLLGAPASVPRPATVRSALSGSRGLAPLVSFGPMIVPTPGDLVDQPVPAVQVWQVNVRQAKAEVWDAAAAVRVAGGPESLLTLQEQGLLGDRPTILDGDPEAGPLAGSPLIVTDGPQRREATFSSVRSVYSAPLTATEPWLANRAQHDWMVFDQPETVARYVGVAGISASSQGSAVESPWSAIDGDPATSWRVQWLSTATPWWQVRFDGTILPPRVIQVVPAAGSGVTGVDVVTEQGRVHAVLADPDGRTPDALDVPPGRTAWLRIEITARRPSLPPQQAGLQEVTIPGLHPRRSLQLPEPSQPPARTVLHTARDGTDGCLFAAGIPSCSPELASPGEEDQGLDRLLTLPAGAYHVIASVRPRASPALDGLLASLGAGLTVTASSRQSDEPSAGPQSLVDGDPNTDWIAAPGDAHPRLTISWQGRRRIDAVRLVADPRRTASAATRLRVSTASGSREVTVGPTGWARFRSLSGTSLTISVERIRAVATVDRFGRAVTLPFGAGEVDVPALDDLRRPISPTAAVATRCGSGPVLAVGSVAVQTRVWGTYEDLLQRRDLRLEMCGRSSVPVPGGQIRVTVPADESWQPDALQLVAGGAAELPVPRSPAAAVVQVWDSTARRVAVPARSTSQILVVHENINLGWQATIDGRALEPVRIDGWQQGWVLPPGGAALVRLSFLPNPVYHQGLEVGGLLLLWVLANAGPGQRKRWSALRSALRPVRPDRPDRPARPNRPARRDRPGAGTLSVFGGAFTALILVAAGGWVAGCCVLVAVALLRVRRLLFFLGIAGATLGGLLAAASTSAAGSTFREAAATTALWWALASIVALASSDRPDGRTAGVADTDPVPRNGPLPDRPDDGPGR
jgi:arabinofuranan 3-O-arabinosyltransferase